MTRTMPLPFQPALRLPRSSVHALNALTRRTRDFPIPMGQAGSWRAGLMPVGRASLPAQPVLHIQLDWNGHALALQLPCDAVQVWLEGQYPDLQFTRLPDPLLAALLEIGFDHIAAALHDHGANTLRVVQHHAAPTWQDTDLPHTWLLNLHAQPAGRVIQGLLHSTHATLDALAAFALNYPESPGCTDICTLPLDIAVQVGRTRLPLSTLRSLQAGDVIMLDRCLIDPDGQLWLSLNNALGIRIRHDQGSYIVTQGWSTLMTESDWPDDDFLNDPNGPDTDHTLNNDEEDDDDDDDLDFDYDLNHALKHVLGVDDDLGMDDDQPPDAYPAATTGRIPGDDDPGLDADSMNDYPPEDDTAATGTDALPLAKLNDVTMSLSFDLGQRRLSLAELQALQPGEVFDLARPLNDGPVHIRANGALIGYGELVDIDGRLGIQIVRLGPAQ